MSCLSEETLQSYLDGELAAARHDAARRHLADCATCAAAAREVEGEVEAMRAAFARVQPQSVPTDALHAKLRAAIARENESKTLVTPAAASLAGERRRSLFADWLSLFTPRFSPLAYGFAGSLAVAAFAAAITWSTLPDQNSGKPQIAANNLGARSAPASQPSESSPTVAAQSAVLNAGADFPAADSSDVKIAKVNLPRPYTPGATSGATTKGVGNGAVRLLPGEKNYLKAIISLKSELRAQGDLALQPEMRVEYEQNLAVVDQAIATTRVAAMSDSRDADANALLLAAYQSKVDLLSETVNQTQLASAER